MTSCESLSSQVANLPIPLAPVFTADELALIIGTSVAEAVFVIDTQSGVMVAANPRLLELAGKTLEEVQAGEVQFDQLIYPEDRAVFHTWRGADLSSTAAHFEFRLVDRGGKESCVETSLVPLRWMRKGYLLGFARPIAERKNLERRLREEVDEQKKRTLEAIKASVRVYQITEKIKQSLPLTKNLLNTENESQLFESAARILTGDGLHFKDVTFMVVNENQLVVVHSSKPFQRGQFPLSDQNKYAQFVRRNFDDAGLPKDELLIPLRSRGSLLGLIEVILFPRERVFFDDLRIVSEWQKDILFTIGDIIGLHLDNLRLYGEVKRQSVVDPLTGTFNRHYFVRLLSAEMNRCKRTGRPISLVFVDVDEFKRINDTYGHLQGDHVLRELGGIFTRNLREEDCVCRYGGDEFVVLLPEVDGEKAKLIAEKLLQAVREHGFFSLESPEKPIPVSISIGISSLENNQDEDLFLQAADAALYRAKKMGKNRCETLPGAEPRNTPVILAAPQNSSSTSSSSSSSSS